MSTNQLRILAVGLFAIVAACGIAFAAMYSDYAAYRDGPRTTATVVAVTPRNAQLAVTLRFERGGKPEEMPAYVPLSEAHAFEPGAPVEILLGRDGRGSPMRATRLARERPSVLLIGGGLVALVLGVIVLLAPRRGRARRAARKDPLDVVIDGIARTRNLWFGFAAFLGVSAIGFAALPILATDGTRFERIALLVLAAITVFAAIVVGAAGYKIRDPRRNPLIELITQHPEDIAWIYLRTIRQKGQTMQDAMIWSTTGKSAQIRLVPEDVDAMMAELARRAPHAAQGFSDETERLYKQDPTRWKPR